MDRALELPKDLQDLHNAMEMLAVLELLAYCLVAVPVATLALGTAVIGSRRDLLVCRSVFASGTSKLCRLLAMSAG